MVFKAKPVKDVKKTDSTAAMTFVSPGTEIAGSVHAAGNLRVDGIIRGKVSADGDIEVSAGGLIEGERVSARNIVIHGTVKATLTAQGYLRIHSQGEVQGDVTAEALDIESGARFVGYSHTGKATADIVPIEQTASKDN
ncbi:MAG TPA: polymer-forming cytoskeletal protein [Thiobacillaceae bacterium]|nr:polymer-forming cytoskeletal protein [Thiobacillaceae bacterium]